MRKASKGTAVVARRRADRPAQMTVLPSRAIDAGVAVGDPDSLVSGPQLQKMLGGASRMALHRWQKSAGLPPPLKLGVGSQARNFWRRADILAWIAQRAAAQGVSGTAA